MRRGRSPGAGEPWAWGAAPLPGAPPVKRRTLILTPVFRLLAGNKSHSMFFFWKVWSRLARQHPRTWARPHRSRCMAERYQRVCSPRARAQVRARGVARSGRVLCYASYLLCCCFLCYCLCSRPEPSFGIKTQESDRMAGCPYQEQVAQSFEQSFRSLIVSNAPKGNSIGAKGS